MFFFTWIITEIKLEVSWLWKEFQDEVVHQKTLTKKAPDLFWFLFVYFNISDIFLQNLKFKLMTGFPVPAIPL